MVLSHNRVAIGPTDECQAVVLSEHVIASTDKIKEETRAVVIQASHTDNNLINLLTE